MTEWILPYVLTGILSMGVSAVKLNQGCREMNPLMPSRVKTQMAVKGGSIIGVAWSINFTGKSSPKVAKTLAIIGTAVNTAVAVHDLGVKCDR